MSEKLDFATTLTQLGTGYKGSDECFCWGMTYGCTPDCPVYERGECEVQEENRKNFEKSGLTTPANKCPFDEGTCHEGTGCRYPHCASKTNP